MSVVVMPSAHEMFTPRELAAAYEDFTKRGPQYLNAETGLRAAAYRFGARVCANRLRESSRDGCGGPYSPNLGNRFSPRFASISGEFPLPLPHRNRL